MRYSTVFRSIFPLFLGLVWISAGAAPIPQAPEVPVRGYVLQDFHSGMILAEMNGDESMEPASITKLMTAYLIYQALEKGDIKLSDQVPISENAWRMGGSRMFVEVGSQVSVEDLLMGMVVQSGNDATVALAEYLAGSEEAFVTLMNQEAVRLGLANTHYTNSTGWPNPDHYTTPRDIATLTRIIIKEFPEYYALYEVRSFAYNNITQHNRNRLLWQDESVDGVKTGHTKAAGYCLAASAKRGDMRLISVVLGAANEKDRFSASQALLNYGFRFYETHKLYDASTPLAQARVWKGEVDELPLGLAEDLYVTIPKGRYEDMNASLRVNASIEAPASQGAAFGKVTVTLGADTMTSVPLVALRSVAEAGFLGRVWDQMLLTVYALFE